jgi:hypothetical protein
MNILALDLGTLCGFAYNEGEKIFAGTWVLATDKEVKLWGEQRLTRRCDPRILRLNEKCTALEPSIDAVVYEDVLFASSTYQVQLWSSLRAAVWMAYSHKLLECVPVGTLKKFATNSGSAKKNTMKTYFLRRSDCQRFPRNLDDNGIDASFLWLWGQEKLGRVKI